jgi:hypothetical protein
MNYFSILFLQNNSILINQNSPSTTNNFIKDYRSLINFIGFIDTDKFDNFIYIGYNSEIKILTT